MFDRKNCHVCHEVDNIRKTNLIEGSRVLSKRVRHVYFSPLYSVLCLKRFQSVILLIKGRGVGVVLSAIQTNWHRVVNHSAAPFIARATVKAKMTYRKYT